MSMVAHKSDSDRLVQHHFFEPLGIKQKGSEEKIHLFYDVLNIGFLSGLYHPTKREREMDGIKGTRGEE